MEMEFKGKVSARFKNIAEVVDYMRKFGFHVAYNARKGIFDFEKSKEPQNNDPMEIKQYCLLGRFPLANSIYNDYSLLEKKRLTNEAIDELLYAKKPKKIKKPDTNLYTVSNLDYAQQNAILNLNKYGNIVIYGPPGTGKSQTIVNTITDAICKNKRVLVVSQKKAALDVVFNRLGTLNNKAMYLIDPEKNKNGFYDRVRTTHQQVMEWEPSYLQKNYDELEEKIAKEENELAIISDCLFSPRPFGLTLQEMYTNSYILGKTSYDYTIYRNMLRSPKLLALNYRELSENLRLIKENNYTYEVNTMLSYENFPDKVYGDYVFPQGNYEAFRVIIGEGKGQNWWCVMFPSLCFVDESKNSVDSSDLKEEIENIEPKNTEITNEVKEKNEESSYANNGVKFKFKIVEVIKDILD